MTTYITCKHCGRDVEYSQYDEHEFRCDDQPDVKRKIEKAGEQSVRELVQDMIDRQPFLREMADNRLEVPPDKTGDSDYGLAPHERENNDGQ